MKNSTTDSSILLVGATGYLGMEVCRQLMTTNRNVTALVRSTSAAEKVNALKQMGAKIVEGDLKDITSIKKVLNGITKVISTASSTISSQAGDNIQTVDNEGQINLVDSAEASGVSQYIFVSIPPMTGEFPLQTAKRKVENKITASKIAYTILQPSFFMEAWLSPMIGFDFPNAKATIYGEGKNKISWIALHDVAAFVVASLENPAARNKKLQLGGPEALSPLEVVALFEKAGNKKFNLQHVPVEALQAQQKGAPDDLGKSFASLMLAYASGSEINMNETLKAFPLKLKTVSEYAMQMSQISQAV